ncbi:MAG: helix-turn-helix transcriptional regulator [Ktedonobacteraceae bacterium]|nr:helix-turn-helix transcriptional regulator [Ktedonobacteraceae bacterium]
MARIVGNVSVMNMVSSDNGFWPNEVSVGEVHYPPGSRFGPRRQHFLQLVLLHTGHMRVWVDGEEQAAPAGTVCVLFPGHQEYFAFADESETHHSWLHISPAHFSTELLERLAKLDWPLPLSPAMTQLMHEALLTQATPFPTAKELLKSLALQMLWRYTGEGEQRQKGAAVRANVTVEQAQQFIHTHLHEALTLEQIASIVAVSPQHLIRLFQAHLRTSPMNYLWQRRIARGIELLEQTGLSVGVVAERCGFQSRYHFSRRIRQAVGYTPLEVRQRSWQRR